MNEVKGEAASEERRAVSKSARNAGPVDSRPERWTRAVDWAVRSEASTRSAALIRMGLVLVLWSRWAAPMRWFKADSVADVVVSIVFYLASTAMFFGVCTRISSWLTAGVGAYLFFYLGLFAGERYWVHHHTMLLVYSLILCACTPSGRSFSFDRWWAIRRSQKRGRPWPAERGNLWGIRLMVVMLASIYFWAAFDKINPAFLSGERMQHYLAEFYYGSDFPTVPGFAGLTLVLAWLTVALELALAFAVFAPRKFRWLVVPGLTLHAAFYIMLPVATYTINMWVLYLACFDPDRFHEFLDDICGREPDSRERLLE